jgi:hypothetical protein
VLLAAVIEVRPDPEPDLDSAVALQAALALCERARARDRELPDAARRSLTRSLTLKELTSAKLAINFVDYF